MKKTLLLTLLHFSICIWLLGAANTANAQSYDVQAYQLLVNNPEGFRAQLLANPNMTVNLKGADLRGLDLSRMRLVGADLSYCQLELVSLKESDLTNANLIGAKIMKADFSRSNLAYANFNKTNATDAKFSEAKFKNTITEYLLIQDGHQLNPAYIDQDGVVKPQTK